MLTAAMNVDLNCAAKHSLHDGLGKCKVVLHYTERHLIMGACTWHLCDKLQGPITLLLYHRRCCLCMRTMPQDIRLNAKRASLLNLARHTVLDRARHSTGCRIQAVFGIVILGISTEHHGQQF